MAFFFFKWKEKPFISVQSNSHLPFIHCSTQSVKNIKYLADLSYKQIENSDNKYMTEDFYVIGDALKIIASKDVEMMQHIQQKH